MPPGIPTTPPASIAPGLDPLDEWALGLLFVGLAVMVAIVALTHQRSRAFSPSIVYPAVGLICAAGTAVVDVPCSTWWRTIVVVATFGALAMGLSAGAAVVLGAALAPTDPVLAGDLGGGDATARARAAGRRTRRVGRTRPTP